MGSFIKVMTDTFKDTIVGTLSLSFNTSNIIEKICWLLMWIFGSVLTFMIVSDQLESWKRNPTISSRKWVDLSEVPFPALTFCHQGNTRMEVAERLLEAADESSPKVRHFKSWLLKHTAYGFMQYYTKPFNRPSTVG